MLRPVRTSFLTVAVVVLVFTLLIPVAAQKKSSKRKKKSARSTPVMIVLPIFSPAASPTVSVETAAPVITAAPVESSVTPAASAKGSAMSGESTGDSNTNSKSSKGRIGIEQPHPEGAGSLMISEFRLRGPSGANDEFVEIYNDSGADHTVTALSGTGYAVAASDGVTRCTIPNGTVIPARGHYLCVNAVAYSLGSYPSGSGTATGDAPISADIPDNAGIALFNNNTGGASFSLANRFDAVGSTTEANALYKEGAGYPALTPFSIDYSFVRDDCGKGGAVNLLGKCTISTPKDTDDNAADFYFVDTNGTSAGAGQRLGAPGPQNLQAPIQRNSTIAINNLDSTVGTSNPPNRVRDFTSDPANNSTFGTLSIRRRFVNNTGSFVVRLRFRVIDLDTFPAASGFADMRPRTSVAVVVAGINDAITCLATGAPVTPPCTATVQGTTLEQPPSQPNGGGFNSSMSAGTVTLGTPLANGASINLQFLLGLQQTGNFRIYVNVEALP